MTKISASRVIDPVAAEIGIGYQLGNLVAQLYDYVGFHNGEGAKVDAASIRFHRELDPVAAWVVTAEYDGDFPVDRQTIGKGNTTDEPR